MVVFKTERECVGVFGLGIDRFHPVVTALSGGDSLIATPKIAEP